MLQRDGRTKWVSHRILLRRKGPHEEFKFRRPRRTGADEGTEEAVPYAHQKEDVECEA